MFYYLLPKLQQLKLLCLSVLSSLIDLNIFLGQSYFRYNLAPEQEAEEEEEEE